MQAGVLVCKCTCLLVCVMCERVLFAHVRSWYGYVCAYGVCARAEVRCVRICVHVCLCIHVRMSCIHACVHVLCIFAYKHEHGYVCVLSLKVSACSRLGHCVMV